MSLKIVHAVFITLAMLLAGFFAWWAGARYAATGTMDLLGLSAGSALGCLLLVAYDAAFIRRCRRDGWSS